MPELKLFISHSTIFDESDAEGVHNSLVLELCQLIRAVYHNRIDPLVDKEGLLPGCEWRKRLHGWLCECDAAIILFSQRARDQSDWVKYEASVLSYRASREPGFTLIPVLLCGQTSAENLEQGFWRAINLAERQSISSAASAQDILEKLGKSLEELLACQCPSGFGRRFSTIRALIADYRAKDKDNGQSLFDAWKAIAGPNDKLPEWPIDPIARYSLALTSYIFHGTQNDSSRNPDLGAPCFSDAVNRFRNLYRNMILPFVSPEQIRDYVLPLWVHEQAANDLLETKNSGNLVALNGRYVLHDDPTFNIKKFTLHRYLQRNRLTIDQTMACISISTWDAAEVQALIRTEVNHGDDWKEFDPNSLQILDAEIQQRASPIFLVVDAKCTGLPNDQEADDMLNFCLSVCPALRVVFATGEATPLISGKIRLLTPLLEPGTEYIHLRNERELRTAITG